MIEVKDGSLQKNFLPKTLKYSSIYNDSIESFIPHTVKNQI